MGEAGCPLRAKWDSADETDRHPVRAVRYLDGWVGTRDVPDTPTGFRNNGKSMRMGAGFR